MNLLTFRNFFRDQSGRFDLVSPTGADLGNANTIINEAVKFLDRKIDFHESVGRSFHVVAAGSFYVLFQTCRSIKEVWGYESGQGRWQLEKKTMEDLRAEYTEMWTALDRSFPSYYTPAFIRPIPDTQKMTALQFGAIAGNADIVVATDYDFNGVLFVPPPSSQITIEVWGRFYSSELSGDTDENFWTVRHPLLLYKSVMRQLEIIARNTQGKRDWDEAIGEELMDIDKDVADEEMTEIDELGD